MLRTSGWRSLSRPMRIAVFFSFFLLAIFFYRFALSLIFTQTTTSIHSSSSFSSSALLDETSPQCTSSVSPCVQEGSEQQRSATERFFTQTLLPEARALEEEAINYDLAVRSKRDRFELAKMERELTKVLFLGDSLTEDWRASVFGEPDGRNQGIDAIFDAYFRGGTAESRERVKRESRKKGEEGEGEGNEQEESTTSAKDYALFAVTSSYNAKAWGVAADQTQNALYRLEHLFLQRSFDKKPVDPVALEALFNIDPPSDYWTEKEKREFEVLATRAENFAFARHLRVIVLCLGTNNLSKSLHSVAEVMHGLARILIRLHQIMPYVHILLLALPPRVDWRHNISTKELNALIDGVNYEIEHNNRRRHLWTKDATEKRLLKYVPITMLNCNSIFFTSYPPLSSFSSSSSASSSSASSSSASSSDKRKPDFDFDWGLKGYLRRELLPDGLHPSMEGHRLWAECIARRLPELVQKSDKARKHLLPEGQLSGGKYDEEDEHSQEL